MTQKLRNFPSWWSLSACRGGVKDLIQVLQAQVFELRSLPGVSPDAIPRRFSSSSLPPLFVSGRFAVFFYTGDQRVAQGV